MGSFLSHQSDEQEVTCSIPNISSIDVKSQMKSIIFNWIRLCYNKTDRLSKFPSDIIELIINMFLYQTIFETIHKRKLQDPKDYYQQHKYRYQYDYYLFQLSLVGDSGVGKSCLLLRFSDYTFTESFIPTIGTDFKIKGINLDNKNIKLQIWDPAREYSSKEHDTNVKAHGLLFVYDITNRESFINIKIWYDAINKYAPTDQFRMLVGAKSDLIDTDNLDNDNIVSYDEAKQLAKELNMVHCLETSAKNDTNVEEAFLCLVSQLSNHKALVAKERISRPFYG